MKKNIFIQSRTIIITLLMIVFSVDFAYSQTGQNFDFSYGTYQNWRGYQAQNTSSEGSVSTSITFSAWTGNNDPTQITLGGTNCFVINSNLTENDEQIGSLLKKIPNGYTKSTRINCIPSSGSPNANANKLEFDFNVNDTNCLLTFNFAMVLNTPGHSGFANPFFKIDVIKLNALGQEQGLITPCATFYALGDNDPVPPGFQSFSNGIWQNWKQVSMNLSNYLYENVRIKVVLASCAYTAHWAYGYFVGRVGPSILTVNACGNGDTAAVITAPSGFQKYEWFRATSASITESEMATISSNSSAALYTSTATATSPANNRFTILNAMYSANGQNYFVKVTSPSSDASVPGCVAYMTATAQI